MTTGRIDYSPDYKSESKAARLAVAVDRALRPSLYEGLDRQQAELRVAAECRRLRDAVVEAALRDRAAATKGDGSNRDIDAAIQTRREFNTAVDALLDFESKQDKK